MSAVAEVQSMKMLPDFSNFCREFEGEILLDPLSLPVGERCIIMPTRAFDQIATYQHTEPTFPSPGRFYKRKYAVDWYMFWCLPGEGEYAGMVAHHPFKIIIVDTAQP